MKRPADPTLEAGSGAPASAFNFKVRPRVGFTLLELLIVMGILVIMTGLIAPTVVRQVRETRVAQAAESVRETIARSRTLALDVGIDYQFRFEPNGRHFVVLPLELEPADTNSTVGESDTSNYLRLAGELSEDFRLQATSDRPTVETLEVAWFGKLENALQLSDALWSSPVIFHFDGTAADAGFRVTTDEKLTVDLSVRGLTGSVAVSRVYTEAD